MNTPAYFSPNFFKLGQRAAYGEFTASIIRHAVDGMWEIRVPGGITCVSGADLKPLAQAPFVSRK